MWRFYFVPRTEVFPYKCWSKSQGRSWGSTEAKYRGEDCVCVCVRAVWILISVCTSERVFQSVCVCVLWRSGALHGQSEGELRD